MIQLADYKEFRYQTTLKEASVNQSDEKSKSYMTDICLPVIDFDKVKEQYVRKFELEQVPASNDALLQVGENVFFVEFKDGNMSSEIFDVVRKIYDSLLIYCDITNQTISDIRSYMTYIIVYNGKASKKYIDGCDAKRKNKHTINNSPSFLKWGDMLGKMAKTNADVFGLRGRFGGIYFKNVLSVEKNELSAHIFTADEHAKR